MRLDLCMSPASQLSTFLTLIPTFLPSPFSWKHENETMRDNPHNMGTSISSKSSSVQFLHYSTFRKHVYAMFLSSINVGQRFSHSYKHTLSTTLGDTRVLAAQFRLNVMPTNRRKTVVRNSGNVAFQLKPQQFYSHEAEECEMPTKKTQNAPAENNAFQEWILLNFKLRLCFQMVSRQMVLTFL